MVDGRVFKKRTMLEKLKILLSTDQSNKLYILFSLLVLILIFEMIGIGFIPIYAMLLTDPSIFLDKIPYKLSFIDKENNNELIIYASILLFIIFVVKNLFLAVMIYVEGNLMKLLRIDSGKKLFNHYMNSNYLFYVNSNPSILIRTLNHDIGLSYKYISAYLLLIREFLLVFIILIFLLSVNFIVYLSTFIIFSLVTLFFYFLLKDKLVDKGKALQQEHSKNIKIINQSFSSIKEIKISQKENFFTNIFFESVNLIEKLYFFSYLVSKYPRLLLEVLAVFLIASFAFIMLFFELENQLVPLLALLAAACIRFIPALNSITGSINSLKFYSPSFDLISRELKSIKQSNEKKINVANEIKKTEFDKFLELKNVSFAYPNTKKNALTSVDLKILKGEKIAIIGESGAGKTTLINLILGFLKPDTGEISVDGININKNIVGWQSILGYVPQDVYLMDETLRENIAFGIPKNQTNKQIIDLVVKQSRLENFVNNLPQKLDTNVGNLGSKISGGQRQRIGIARALFSKPEIMILDEATNSLDKENENKIIEEILENTNKKTIIMISHRHSNIKNFDKIYNIHEGKVFLNEKI